MIINTGPIDTVLPSPESAVAATTQGATGRPDPAAAGLLDAALAHHRAGRLPLAAILYRNLLKRTLEPAIRGTVHYNLGVIAQRQQRPAAARDEYRQALQHHPRLFLAYNNLGNVLHDLGQTEKALECFAHALAIQPAFAPALLNRAVALRALGRLDEALASCRNAQDLDPRLAEASYTEGNIQFDRGQIAAALVCYDRALAIRPDDAHTLINRGNALAELGRLTDAEDSYRQAQRLAPREPMPHSNLLFLNAYTRHRPPPELRTLAEGWERAVLTAAERAAARARTFADRAPRQGRPLRLGILSAELGRHAVGQFLRSWMVALDRQRIQLFLYPTQTRPEPQAALFQNLADAWIPLDGLTDAEAAARIRADRIDLLIETSGHTQGNRLRIPAHRAAPVQCTWIGYWSTTGLTEMDYFIADAVLAPPEVEPQFCERIWRLDRPWMAYAPLEDAPTPAWRPDPAGRLWLGSFNDYNKLGPPCLRLWARLLHALPEARLLLKHRKAQDPTAQTRIRSTLSALGVAPERIEFLDRNDTWRDHMALYDRLDLALDTIPYNSGSTGFDALWMGVPLITLAGDWVGGRMMAAMLAGFGQTDWIARDEDEYVAKVAALARDVPFRQALRAAQRERMRASPLCDGAGLARALEAAFEGMFDQWWAHHHGTPPGAPTQREYDDRAARQAALIACFEQRRLTEAHDLARQLVTHDPGEVFGWRALGVILLELGQPEAAVLAFEQALRLNARDVESLNSLGNALKTLGQPEAARQRFEQALRILPDFAAAHSNLGATLQDLGRLEDALACFERALALQPDLPEAHNNLGNALRALGRQPEALVRYERALALRPDSADALCNLGIVLTELGRAREALDCLQRALTLAPNLAEARLNLGNTLAELGQTEAAARCFEQALALQPGCVEAHNNLANALGDLGRPDEALAVSARAIALRPENAVAQSNRLLLRSYHRCGSPMEIRDAARGWEQAVLSESARVEAQARRFAPAPRLGRPLRIGILSAELGQHPVAYFLLPWMRDLNHERCTLLLYPTRARHEPQAADFRALADAWAPLTGLGDDEAAARIRADRVDVLIDTSGHTAGNRLGIVARRAAPVQCHYIGYWCTTGLTEMDWFIGDPALIPPALDGYFTERVWRLDRPWMAYAPLEDAPEPGWRPDPAGTLWLGSFNNLAKVRDECLALWARLLHALPEARLLLKDRKAGEAPIQNRIRATLARAGIEPARVEFLGRTASWRDHMALYDRLDLALDTVPYNSGSTGFEALWMGVPLVAIAGDWVGGRMMAAMLAGFGQTDWMARDEDDYVARVVALARDVEQRRVLRATQRARMRASPLCDGAGLARALEAAWEGMFDEWRDRQR